MSRFTLILAILLLGLVAWLLWGGAGEPGNRTALTEEPDRESSREEAETPAKEFPGREFGKLQADRQALSVDSELADRPPRELGIPSFRGRVLLPEGDPAEDAWVQAFGMTGWAGYIDPENPALRPVVTWEVRTGANGRFALPEVPRDGLRFLLRIRAEGYPPMEWVNQPAIPGRTRDLRDLRLQHGFRIQGTVSDNFQVPIVGAKVVAITEADRANIGRAFHHRLPALDGYEATTDAQGQFVLEQLPPGRIRLRGTAPGFMPNESAPAKGGSHDELEGISLILSKSTTLQGFVLDSARRPVADARLRLEFNGDRLEQLSQSDGRFQFDPPADLRTMVLRCVAAGYWPTRSVIRDDARHLPVEISLKEVPALQGIVVDELGQSVAGATVALVEARQARNFLFHPESLNRIGETSTTADGTFSLSMNLTHTWERRFVVLAWASEKVPAQSQILAIDENKYQEIRPIRLELGAGIGVRGMVQDPYGQTRAGARVHLRRLHVQRGRSRLPNNNSRRSGVIYQTQTTGPQGEFAFSALPAADYRLEAYYSGYSPVESEDFALLDQPHEEVLQLIAPTHIEGTIVGMLDGMTSLRVTASSVDHDVLDTMADGDGNFEFRHIHPGTYWLTVREVDATLASQYFGYGSGDGLGKVEGVKVAAGQTTQAIIELDLGERGHLQGTVWINGSGSSDLNLYLIPQDLGSGRGNLTVQWRYLANRIRSTATDFAGKYRFSAIDPGDYWVVLERGNSWPDGLLRRNTPEQAPGPKGLARYPIQIEPSRTAQQDFQLSLGHVEGRGFYRDPKNNRKVFLRGGSAYLRPFQHEDGVAQRKVNIRGNGRFTFADVPVGTWELELQSGKLIMEPKTLEINAAEPVRLGIEMTRAASTEKN